MEKANQRRVLTVFQALRGLFVDKVFTALIAE